MLEGTLTVQLLYTVINVWRGHYRVGLAIHHVESHYRVEGTLLCGGDITVWRGFTVWRGTSPCFVSHFIVWRAITVWRGTTVWRAITVLRAITLLEGTLPCAATIHGK